TGIRIPSGSRDFLEELRNCAPELLSGYMANNGQLVRVRNGLDHIHTRSSGSWADENVKQDIRMGIMIGMFVPVPVGGTFSVSLTEIVGTRPGYFFTAGENAIIGLLRRKGVESIISRPISGVPHGVSVLTTERQAMTAIPFNHHGVEDLLRSF
ncbi:MAG: hypothetical protein JXA66_09195, partial [Oligoflexia bacterium]|nr:hypothetical protein [Oligoflexia bacterium]